MGTHPIFESDFDCLTESKSLDKNESGRKISHCFAKICSSNGEVYDHQNGFFNSCASPNEQVTASSHFFRIPFFLHQHFFLPVWYDQTETVKVYRKMQKYLICSWEIFVVKKAIRLFRIVHFRHIYMLHGRVGVMGRSQLRKWSCRVCD